MTAVKLIPALKQTIWGGQRLKDVYDGKGMENIAESWVLSCHPAGESRIAEGDFAGKTLQEVLAQNGRAVLGEKCPPGAFPLLIKLIDAADDLSVQVHPGDEYARLHENSFGKTECWYLLDAAEDAQLIFGMKDELTREQFRKAIEDNTLLSHVRRVKVHAGDVAYIPAGTLHAIGRGILLAEVQQSSDVTYRVYDYGRLQNGKPRDLHIRQAIDVTNLTPSNASLAPAGQEEDCGGYLTQTLCRCERFCMTKLLVRSAYEGFAGTDSFLSLVVLAGEGSYRDGSTAFPLKKGDSVFVPAGEGKFSIEGKLTLLLTTL